VDGVFNESHERLYRIISAGTKMDFCCVQMLADLEGSKSKPTTALSGLKTTDATTFLEYKQSKHTLKMPLVILSAHALIYTETRSYL